MRYVVEIESSDAVFASKMHRQQQAKATAEEAEEQAKCKASKQAGRHGTAGFG